MVGGGAMPRRSSFPVLALLTLACGRADTVNPSEPVATTTSATTSASDLPAAEVDLLPEIEATIRVAWAEVDAISAERKADLDAIAEWIRKRVGAGEPASLVFICTHNSRRSHMGQLWAATAAAYFGVDGVRTFSGGTEATAFNPRAVAALTRAGFRISPEDAAEENPRYRVAFSDDVPASDAWSKTWDDPANPSEGFAAVMTCSDARQGLPVRARRGSPVRDPL